jgi:hypothetical protein
MAYANSAQREQLRSQTLNLTISAGRRLTSRLSLDPQPR